eukprot:ANDGO_01531.mRNA.1 hypothetical protein
MHAFHGDGRWNVCSVCEDHSTYRYCDGESAEIKLVDAKSQRPRPWKHIVVDPFGVFKKVEHRHVESLVMLGCPITILKRLTLLPQSLLNSFATASAAKQLNDFIQLDPPGVLHIRSISIDRSLQPGISLWYESTASLDGVLLRMFSTLSDVFPFLICNTQTSWSFFPCEPKKVTLQGRDVSAVEITLLNSGIFDTILSKRNSLRFLPQNRQFVASALDALEPFLQSSPLSAKNAGLLQFDVTSEVGSLLSIAAVFFGAHLGCIDFELSDTVKSVLDTSYPLLSISLVMMAIATQAASVSPSLAYLQECRNFLVSDCWASGMVGPAQSVPCSSCHWIASSSVEVEYASLLEMVSKRMCSLFCPSIHVVPMFCSYVCFPFASTRMMIAVRHPAEPSGMLTALSTDTLLDMADTLLSHKVCVTSLAKDEELPSRYAYPAPEDDSNGLVQIISNDHVVGPNYVCYEHGSDDLNSSFETFKRSLRSSVSSPGLEPSLASPRLVNEFHSLMSSLRDGTVLDDIPDLPEVLNILLDDTPPEGSFMEASLADTVCLSAHDCNSMDILDFYEDNIAGLPKGPPLPERQNFAESLDASFCMSNVGLGLVGGGNTGDGAVDAANESLSDTQISFHIYTPSFTAGEDLQSSFGRSAARLRKLNIASPDSEEMSETFGALRAWIMHTHTDLNVTSGAYSSMMTFAQRFDEYLLNNQKGPLDRTLLDAVQQCIFCLTSMSVVEITHRLRTFIGFKRLVSASLFSFLDSTVGLGFREHLFCGDVFPSILHSLVPLSYHFGSFVCSLLDRCIPLRNAFEHAMKIIKRKGLRERETYMIMFTKCVNGMLKEGKVALDTCVLTLVSRCSELLAPGNWPQMISLCALRLFVFQDRSHAKAFTLAALAADLWTDGCASRQLFRRPPLESVSQLVKSDSPFAVPVLKAYIALCDKRMNPRAKKNVQMAVAVLRTVCPQLAPLFMRSTDLRGGTTHEQISKFLQDSFIRDKSAHLTDLSKLEDAECTSHTS